MRALVFLVFVASIGAARALGQNTPDFEGKPITRIDFEPPLSGQPMPGPELDRRMALQIGAPLRMVDVRDAIEQLYATGRYSDISVDARAEENGVALRVDTVFNYFISGVNIEGEADPPNRDQLRAATKLELGRLFGGNVAINQAEQNMQERLRANGLYSANIETRVDRTNLTEEANIFFTIETGKRARFGGVEFLGETELSTSKLIRRTGWHRGLAFVVLPGWREFTQSRLQSGIGRVQSTIQRGDHWQARVTLEELQFHPETNRVTPVLRIDNGPVLTVTTTGLKLSAGKLHDLVPIYQERTSDRGLLLEGERSLRNYFQSQGYFDASVEVSDHLEDNRTAVNYDIVRGLRHKLVKIQITGNRYFDTPTLRERLSMAPAEFPRYRWGKFSQRLMDQDKNSIEYLYRSNGFRDAEVMIPRPVDNYNGKTGDLEVEIQVNEGVQWLVHSLDFRGVPEGDIERFRPILQSIPGQPFSDAAVAADRDTILTYYYNNGYSDATFDWTEMPGASPNEVDLTFVVALGRQQVVRNVLVRGLQTTRPGIVANRISLIPGGPMAQNEIIQSQQKLYDLRVFSKVETALQNPDGEEDSKYVLFHLDEASRYSFNAGFGAQLGRIGGGTTTLSDPAGTASFSPRVSLGVSRLNTFGLGHTVGLQTLLSTIEQRVLLTYLVPQFQGNDNFSLSVSGLLDDSNDIRTFTAHRLEASIQLAQRLSRANTIQYRYTYRHVTIPEDTLKISPELIPLFSQPDLTGSLSFSFIQDRRDDPANSTRGFLNTIDFGFAGSKLGSETDFTRLQLRNSTYTRIGRDLVFARTTTFGYIQRLGGVPGIPLAERFFSGGATTNRAFPENQAGPRDLETGFPLGGNAFLFNSLELRFPLIGDNVGGVLFHDMGNVYSDVNSISLRFRQINNQDFNYAVHGFGFGIRYRTPIGPIRVDFSLSPNSPRFVGYSGTLDQLLAGTGTPNVPQRINTFQFHFSLGQTF
ncbi:MAG: BamA/TamA family outer membrane protein [Bryobacterales bacterium]|nr:BamA/TamA family outer membrane protein [Bryobacterales bacterium]MBV9397380.1 BamA/TamA family outer membrane protein [Bryobacterales bacterium]